METTITEFGSIKHTVTLFLDKRQERVLKRVLEVWRQKYAAGIIGVPATEETLLQAALVRGLEQMEMTWCRDDA